MSKNKGLQIDSAIGSSIRDSQGEVLNIEGADISELEAGRGKWTDNHGAGFFNCLGRITDAKKIFKAEDCDTDRQKYYWDKIKAPYIYAAGYLYDHEDHPNAKAAAAILRNIHKSDAPLQLKASVEGGIIARGSKDSTLLERTKILGSALTFTPANRNTLVEPLNLSKSFSYEQEALDQELIKSVIHLAKRDEEIPSFRHIERDAQAHKIINKIDQIRELAKSIGIELEIKEINSDLLVSNAIEAKLLKTVKRINTLVKNINIDNVIPSAIKTDTAPSSQVKVGNQASTINQKTHILAPNHTNVGRAENEIVPQTTGEAFKNKLKIHEHKKRYTKDPNYEHTVRNTLTSQGVHPNRINRIISIIKGSGNINKSEDDLEKIFSAKELLSGARTAVLAGTVAAAAHGITDLKPKVENEAPRVTQATQIIRDIDAKHLPEKSNKLLRDMEAQDKKIKATKVKKKIKLTKSESLRKERGEDSEVPSTFHGWISPKGEFHQMGDNEHHDFWIHNKLTDPKYPTTAFTDDKNHNTSDDDWDMVEKSARKAHSAGWISVGHAGMPTIVAHTDTLEDRTHPAFRKARQLVKEHNFPELEIGVRDKDKYGSEKIARADSHIFAKFGTIKPLKKALTAGCGGGMPTSGTGGQVLQTESLEGKGKVKGFKYITCDTCGEEGIHHPNQVKCRKCNKNFSLKKIYDTIIGK